MSPAVGSASVVEVPGRICLLGEHCDWAGGAALVVPMDRVVRVRAEPADTLDATALLERRAIAWQDGEGGPLRFVGAVADELDARFGGVRGAHVHVDGDLPAGRGFSSSAAVCVALVRALGDLRGLTLDRSTEIEVAYAAEHDRCGVACGRLDPTAVAWGAPLFLRFLGEDVDATPVPASFELAVGSFSAPRDTAGILATLGRYHRGDVPLRDFSAVQAVGAVRGAIEGFAVQAGHARDALLDGDLVALGAAMNVCQDIYEEELMATLPVLHAPGLVRAVRALRAAGALGAKFSGAGGDGSVIGLFPGGGRVAAGVQALDKLGLASFAMEVWCPA